MYQEDLADPTWPFLFCPNDLASFLLVLTLTEAHWGLEAGGRSLDGRTAKSLWACLKTVASIETTNGATHGHRATRKKRLVGKQSEIGLRVIVSEVLV